MCRCRIHQKQLKLDSIVWRKMLKGSRTLTVMWHVERKLYLGNRFFFCWGHDPPVRVRRAKADSVETSFGWVIVIDTRASFCIETEVSKKTQEVKQSPRPMPTVTLKDKEQKIGNMMQQPSSSSAKTIQINQKDHLAGAGEPLQLGTVFGLIKSARKNTLKPTVWNVIELARRDPLHATTAFSRTFFFWDDSHQHDARPSHHHCCEDRRYAETAH